MQGSGVQIPSAPPGTTQRQHTPLGAVCQRFARVSRLVSMRPLCALTGLRLAAYNESCREEFLHGSPSRPCGRPPTAAVLCRQTGPPPKAAFLVPANGLPSPSSPLLGLPCEKSGGNDRRQALARSGAISRWCSATSAQVNPYARTVADQAGSAGGCDGSALQTGRSCAVNCRRRSPLGTCATSGRAAAGVDRAGVG
jgi:hypothetical protein